MALPARNRSAATALAIAADPDEEKGTRIAFVKWNPNAAVRVTRVSF
jgi:hypothetical protein